MKKVLCLLLALVLCVSLVACGNSEAQYIGVWEYTGEIPSDSSRYFHQLKVYKGGSGDRVIIDKNNPNHIILPFSWEINDGVFNMITSDFGEANKMGFVIKNGVLTSVNGEYTFEKSKN